MDQRERAFVGVVLVVVGAIIGAGVTAGVGVPSSGDPGTPTQQHRPESVARKSALRTGNASAESVVQFTSERAFAAYVQRGQQLATQRAGFTGRVTIGRPVVAGGNIAPQPQIVREQVQATPKASGTTSDSPSAGEPARVSTTNVQVQGLDEPDILKTDGTHVYYAPKRTGRYYWEHGTGDGRTHIIGASPPSDPMQVATIDESGRLLLTGDRLLVIQDDRLVGYDVSDPDHPQQVWTTPLDDDLVTARLADGTVTLVTKSGLSLSDPCPIRPLGDEVTVPCTQVYHPRRQAPVDATYTVLSLAPSTGDVRDATSFVGTSDQTAVYMSEHGVYVTYTERANRGDLRIDFLLSQEHDRLPSWVETRLSEIRGYNISASATRSEADRVLWQWYRTLDDGERQTARSEIDNDYRDYLAAHQRDLVTTGIVKVGVGDNRSVDIVGSVPGEPLDQFALDEHDGTLRVTTAIPRAGTAQSRNDLYVLDSETLDRRGTVRNMGEGERVYAVRYVGDTAYVVTFRRTDPFHVVDLSNPDDPRAVGRLKLPGFSSYLHPVDDTHVLGIGREDGHVKAVLFDVSDPNDPTVADTYVLNARWSAVSESHHAFLLDRDHGVFFLPTGSGGRIIDYTGGHLSLQTAVDTDGPARRAMYVDDSMYLFGTDELVVLDETTWNRTQTVGLD
ncbi:MAG: beta-propeller domain-containing protein [Halorientalis sp.]